MSASLPCFCEESHPAFVTHEDYTLEFCLQDSILQHAWLQHSHWLAQAVNLEPPSTKAIQPLSCPRCVEVAPARMRSIAGLLRCSQENLSKKEGALPKKNTHYSGHFLNLKTPCWQRVSLTTAIANTKDC